MTWFWLTLAATVTYGLSYVATAPLIKVLPLNVFYLLFAACSTILFAGITFYRNNWNAFELLRQPDTGKWALVMFASSVAGSVLATLAIRHSNPTAVGILEMSYPVFTALFAWWLLGDSFLSKGNVAGGVLIMTGVVVMMVWK